MKSFNRVFNIVISAVCMGLAQHPLGLGWMSWFCLVPLFVSLKESSTFKKIALDALIWGFIYHLVSIYWLSDNIGVDERYIALITMLLANMVCTANIVLIFIIWHIINNLSGRKAWYALPFIWTMVDYLRSFGQVSFPWASIANTHAQSSLLPFVQFIELTGMFGITFWIVLLNVSILYLYDKRTKNKIADTLAIFFLPLILGIILSKIPINDIEKIDFAILQPNIHINNKSNSCDSTPMIKKLINKSDMYINDNFSKNTLLIWPETSFNHCFSPNIKNRVIPKRLKGSNINLLSGVFEHRDRSIYNSIYYLNKNNNYALNDAQIYRKMQMVPGAEYVPLTGVFPFLKNIALSGNFSIGDRYTLFDYKNSRFGAMICIESTYSHLSRNFINQGANFLVYVANDGWYLHPPQAQQHAKQTIFRAIETRKPILRCGNTGISWVVSPSGEILKSLKQNSDDILTSENLEVYSNDTKTLYVLLGDWLAYISIIVSFYLILGGTIRKYRL